MNIIYDNECFCVTEYSAQHGYELVDKQWRRGMFFQGDLADRFLQSLDDVVAEDGASAESIDEFPADYGGLMSQCVLYQ